MTGGARWLRWLRPALCVLFGTLIVAHQLSALSRLESHAIATEAPSTAPLPETQAPVAAKRPASFTLVTSFFHANKTKHSHGEFMKWSRGLLHLNCSLVLFTDSQQLIDMRLATRFPTHYVKTNLSSFRTYTTYVDRLRSIVASNRDPQSKNHGAELYVIWYMKVELVQRAIELNPFNSTHYLWVDVAMQRNIAKQKLWAGAAFPDPSKYHRLTQHDGRMVFFSVGGHYNRICQGVSWFSARLNAPFVGDLPIEKSLANVSALEPKSLYFFPPVFIVGTYWGGDVPSFTRFREAYAARLHEYLFAERPFYNLQDQSLFLYLACCVLWLVCTLAFCANRPLLLQARDPTLWSSLHPTIIARRRRCALRKCGFICFPTY